MKSPVKVWMSQRWPIYPKYTEMKMGWLKKGELIDSISVDINPD